MTEQLLDKEDLEFLKNLANEIQTQDARWTAMPYFYVIREPSMTPVPDGWGEKTIWVEQHSGDCCKYDNKEEYVKHLLEDGYCEDKEEAESRAEKELVEYDVKETYSESNFFLTERGCKKHLELNGHNLGKDCYNFIKHAYRNPEIDRLVQIILKFADKVENNNEEKY